MDRIDPENSIESYRVELYCFDTSTNEPTASPTSSPTASPTDPSPDAISRIFSEITTDTEARTVFWVQPYAGSEDAFIAYYNICVQLKDGSLPEICDNEAAIGIADGGVTANYDLDADLFELEPDNDYRVAVTAVNQYLRTSTTEGVFTTDSTRRRLSSTSNNATSTRQLTNCDGCGDRFQTLVEEYTVMAIEDVSAVVFSPVEYELCCYVQVTTIADNCESEPVNDECCTYIDCPEVPQVDCTTSDDVVTASWTDSLSGNADHILGWEIAVVETTVGQYLCDRGLAGFAACGEVVPENGLAVCDETVAEVCSGLYASEPSSNIENSGATLWYACSSQCASLSEMAEHFDGIVTHNQ